MKKEIQDFYSGITKKSGINLSYAFGFGVITHP